MKTTERIERISERLPYQASDVIHGLNHPREIVSEVNQHYNHWRAGRPYNTRGIDVFGEDWDNLLILDACRYDEFVRCSDLPGRTEHRISRGSTSPEFVRGNFGSKRLHNVVYVTANNWYAKIKDDIDAEIHALEFVERDAIGSRTSRPETVSAAARTAAEKYPQKRLVVHYMQPHHPFLGPTGEGFDQLSSLAKQGLHGELIDEGVLSHADLIDAYRENLDLVLAEARTLLEDLPGKTVVTADHGELLGDREFPIPVRAYRHPEGVYVDALVKVPWHVYEPGDRKTIVAEEPIETDEIDIDAVEQHLHDLGYRV